MERIEPRLPTRRNDSESAPTAATHAASGPVTLSQARRAVQPVAQPAAPPAPHQWIQLRSAPLAAHDRFGQLQRSYSLSTLAPIYRGMAMP